jgi:hypothetical protein
VGIAYKKTGTGTNIELGTLKYITQSPNTEELKK